MALLKFKTDDNLKQIVAHAKAGPEWKDTYGVKATGPTIWLVHDQGVYLMSAAKCGNPIVEGKCQQRAAYAEGMNPDTDPCWYNTARDAVGGDDFAQPLPLDRWSEMLDQYKEIHILLTKRTVRVSVAKPKARLRIVNV
jgi:hypothetical protein